MDIYRNEKTKKLSNALKLTNNVYVSLVEYLTLDQYIKCHVYQCQTIHLQPCLKCEGMVYVVCIIKDNGYCLLTSAFKFAAPSRKYTSEIARRYLLQMPLVSITVGEPKSGKSFSVIMEKYHGADYTKISMLLSCMANREAKNSSHPLDKFVVMSLLNIAQNDRERASLKYAIVKASNLTSSAARRIYGFEQTRKLEQRVKDAIVTAKRISEAVDDLARVEDKAFLISLGVQVSDSDMNEDTGDELVESGVSLSDINDTSETDTPPSLDKLHKLMCDSRFNWFQFYEHLELEQIKNIDNVSENLFLHLSDLNFSENELMLIHQSREAFILTEQESAEQKRQARGLNGEVVSESSDTDCGQECCPFPSENFLSEATRNLIKKKRASIKRKAYRLKIRKKKEANFLSRKVGWNLLAV